jgi:hypothetical protein
MTMIAFLGRVICDSAFRGHGRVFPHASFLERYPWDVKLISLPLFVRFAALG